MGKNVHVASRPDGKWQAKTEGSSKAAKVTDTQKRAIDVGRNIAKNQQSELVIHGVDGRIRDKDSYGNDPVPPRDTRN